MAIWKVRSKSVQTKKYQANGRRDGEYEHVSLKKTVHIVCARAPWPCHRGSQTDTFYRLRSLCQQGIAIKLHYFAHPNEGHPNELNPYCESVHIYPLVKRGKKGLPKAIRYRTDPALLSSLEKDDHPILWEDLSVCGHLNALVRSGRKMVIRIGKWPTSYYRELASNTRYPLRWMRWKLAQRQWQRFLKGLPAAVTYACANEVIQKQCMTSRGLPHSFTLHPFTPYHEVKGREGIGSFCLLHGNLSLPENQQLVDWLLTKVFARIKVPLVVAGENPTARIEKLVHLYQHTCLVANPSDTELDDLIQKAQLTIVPSMVTPGTNLKVLRSLSLGRHCISNLKAVSGTPLQEACYMAETADAMAAMIVQLQYRSFGEEEIRLRNKIVTRHYNDQLNTERLIAYLW